MTENKNLKYRRLPGGHFLARDLTSQLRVGVAATRGLLVSILPAKTGTPL